MSRSTLISSKIYIRPSQKLKSFIATLKDVDSMPENVLAIFEEETKQQWQKDLFMDIIATEQLTKLQFDILNKIREIDELETTDVIKEVLEEDCNYDDERNETFLELNDIKWIHRILREQRNEKLSNIYLHDILHGSKLILPENEIIPRNPELEARCAKLREEQNAKEYRNMTKNVDMCRRHAVDDSIGHQIRDINRQLIAILQFIFSVAAGFIFGFLGVELIVGNLDFGFRLLLGMICALTIALAEIYFLAKKLNEYDVITYENPKNLEKYHVD